MNASTALGAVRFGVNYVPRSEWWYAWMDWDAGSIREDLTAIADLGMDHIRIHCLWPFFQPGPQKVSSLALDRLSQLMDLADAAQLDVSVTVLDGFLSGMAFLPGFQRPWAGPQNLFTSPMMLEAEEHLFTALAHRIATHRRFLGFDLGNELSVMPEFGHPITLAEGQAWQSRLLALCERLAPGKFHVNGVDHKPWFHNRAFPRSGLANTGAATSLHSWVEFTGARARYGSLGTGAVHLLEYNIELANAYAERNDRPVWIQEFGAAPSWVPNNELQAFVEQSVGNGLRTETVWGFTWWCSHDIAAWRREFDPGEFTLGLLDQQNRRTSRGEVFQRVTEAARTQGRQPAARSVGLVVRETDFDEDPGQFAWPDNPGWNVARPWMDLVREGLRPALVLGRNRDNRQHLASRGIGQLFDPRLGQGESP